jgi:hypothetical protein
MNDMFVMLTPLFDPPLMNSDLVQACHQIVVSREILNCRKRNNFYVLSRCKEQQIRLDSTSNRLGNADMISDRGVHDCV